MIRFLKNLLHSFLKWDSKVSHQVPSINEAEVFARFVLDTSQFRRTDNTVKHTAFLPPRKNLKLSAFITSSLSEEDIWKHGVEVASKRAKKLFGRADIEYHHIKRNSLSAVPDNLPHINIVGWSDDEAQRLYVATELALAANFYLIPAK